ncbi:MAG: ABC transporter ATP-binding protein [Kordiimonadaceae bacterium]|jgi:iron complex transport system ATP-binding protein|nr:ABC transporter ATP-binding protein [Kordiimonadaceae bacterium]MBT6030972.1 ABC transporter ATP-binding protein [Kordiimonadaceae bacterium]
MSGLIIKNVSLELGGASILKNISADVNRGEIVGLIGPNGAGKSSLLRSILGLVQMKSGEVFIDGTDLKDLSLKKRAQKMSYAAQGAPVHWPLTVEHIVALGRVPHLNPWQKLSVDDEIAIDYAIERTDCSSLRGRLVTTLSGGERARVLLARVLATGAPYVLADEPVASLDPAHQLQVMGILKNLSNNNHGVMVVMHDLSLALRYCDRIILLNEGQMLGQDTPDVILNDENLRDVFGIRASRWADNGEDFLIAHHIKRGS